MQETRGARRFEFLIKVEEGECVLDGRDDNTLPFTNAVCLIPHEPRPLAAPSSLLPYPPPLPSIAPMPLLFRGSFVFLPLLFSPSLLSLFPPKGQVAPSPVLFSPFSGRLTRPIPIQRGSPSSDAGPSWVAHPPSPERTIKR